MITLRVPLNRAERIAQGIASNALWTDMALEEKDLKQLSTEGRKVLNALVEKDGDACRNVCIPGAGASVTIKPLVETSQKALIDAIEDLAARLAEATVEWNLAEQKKQEDLAKQKAEYHAALARGDLSAVRRVGNLLQPLPGEEAALADKAVRAAIAAYLNPGTTRPTDILHQNGSYWFQLAALGTPAPYARVPPDLEARVASLMAERRALAEAEVQAKRAQALKEIGASDDDLLLDAAGLLPRACVADLLTQLLRLFVQDCKIKLFDWLDTERYWTGNSVKPENLTKEQRLLLLSVCNRLDMETEVPWPLSDDGFMLPRTMKIRRDLEVTVEVTCYSIRVGIEHKTLDVSSDAIIVARWPKKASIDECPHAASEDAGFAP